MGVPGGIPGIWGANITFVRMPCSSTICWTMWPGATCIGIGKGGPLLETIRTVAGPEERSGRYRKEKKKNNPLIQGSPKHVSSCALY